MIKNSIPGPRTDRQFHVLGAMYPYMALRLVQQTENSSSPPAIAKRRHGILFRLGPRNTPVGSSSRHSFSLFD